METLNLYLVQREDTIDPNQYDSIVAASKDSERARRILPTRSAIEDGTWITDSYYIRVMLIGTTTIYGEGCVIHKSFKAG